MMQGIPTWLFYTASAVIMTVSFLFFALYTRTEVEAPKGYATIDLLRVTWFRRLLASPFFKFSVRLFVTGLFILVILTGLYGTYFPGANISTILTWTIWWVLLVLLIAFLGKTWCYLCPWDAISWWLERLSLWKTECEM